MNIYHSFKVTQTRSSHPEVFCKNVFLEISQNSQENTCARDSFLIKLQVFSCEFCEISINSFFIEHFWWLLLSKQFSNSK